jgi:peptidoglycan/LPS O-acetylase OafA/YrhL
MRRSAGKRLTLAAAALVGAVPMGFGLLRFVSTGSDARSVWMAFAAMLFAIGVLVGGIGRRRSRREVVRQSVVILVVSTALAGGTAYIFGATAAAGIWMVSGAFGLCLATASLLLALSRPASDG